MKKKASIVILSVVIALQIAITSLMAVYGYNAGGLIEKYGKEYKFKVKVTHIYDFSIGYEFEDFHYFSLYGSDRQSYAKIVTDEEGYSKFEELSKGEELPEDYISIINENAFPKRCYYEIPEEVDGYIYINHETEQEIRELDSYITVKVWRGQALVTGFYIDGTEYDEFFENLEIKLPEEEEDEEEVIFESAEDDDDLVDFEDYE